MPRLWVRAPPPEHRGASLTRRHVTVPPGIRAEGSPNRYTRAMRSSRTALVAGFALGYYYGARAGRERFEQIDDVLRTVAASAPVRAARDAAERALSDAIAVARELLEGEGQPTGARGRPSSDDPTLPFDFDRDRDRWDDTAELERIDPTAWN